LNDPSASLPRCLETVGPPTGYTCIYVINSLGIVSLVTAEILTDCRVCRELANGVLNADHVSALELDER